jgi:hypothetical protein
VSEPLGHVPGVWNEVREATYAVASAAAMPSSDRSARGRAQDRYENSAAALDKIMFHAMNRLARCVAKRHKRNGRAGGRCLAKLRVLDEASTPGALLVLSTRARLLVDDCD